MLKVGDKAPAFCAFNQDDTEICLRDIVGNWIVLYFYPKDMTPGCTTQACDFTANLYKFDNLKATVIGVSPDDSAKHRKFIEKYDLAITLLADEDKKMAQAYGVDNLAQFAEENASSGQITKENMNNLEQVMEQCKGSTDKIANVSAELVTQIKKFSGNGLKKR
jgi:peroxiredoxin